MDSAKSEDDCNKTPPDDLLGRGFVSFEFISNESAPYLVGLPNGVQVALRFWNCDMLK